MLGDQTLRASSVDDSLKQEEKKKKIPEGFYPHRTGDRRDGFGPNPQSDR